MVPSRKDDVSTGDDAGAHPGTGSYVPERFGYADEAPAGATHTASLPGPRPEVQLDESPSAAYARATTEQRLAAGDLDLNQTLIHTMEGLPHR